jgi:putative restriction endonuclease
VTLADEDRQSRLRTAAVDWVVRVTNDGAEPVTRDQLVNDFLFEGERFPLVDAGRGIRKPAGWDAALTIMTAAAKPGRSRPYDDDEGPDGLHRYKLRRDQRGTADNLGLRVAMQRQLALIWFIGIEPGVFTAIAPTYLIAEEPEDDQFVLALSEVQRGVHLDSPVESLLRGYLLAETKRRLHQPVFANRVMRAYETRCAVCSLGHRQLLDAAHVIPDSHPDGAPVVPNGLALCKIHHAAYDRNILGIRPDYVVEIHHRLLDEIDGPMLKYGLQEHDGLRLRQIPRGRADRPDPERLEVRYTQFRSA